MTDGIVARVDGEHGKRPILPSTSLGWWGVGVSLLGFTMFLFILPTITMMFRETYPITDSWVMPTGGAAVLLLGVALGIAALRSQERSRLVIGVLFVTAVFSLIALATLIGGAIFEG